MKWTREMYQYLSLKTLSKVFENTSTDEVERDIISTLEKEIRSQLDLHQLNFVAYRLRQLKNKYNENIYAQVESEFDRWDRDNEDEYYPSVEFDEKTYDIWTRAVRGKITVNIIYESTTSGLTHRLIDPYKTTSPYGEGYCHLKNEVRKFRFDRIIEISLTDNKFVKLKNKYTYDK